MHDLDVELVIDLEHRDLVCGMNLSMAEGIVDGTKATTYEPILDPQPGWCCVTYRPVTG